MGDFLVTCIYSILFFLLTLEGMGSSRNYFISIARSMRARVDKGRSGQRYCQSLDARTEKETGPINH